MGELKRDAMKRTGKRAKALAMSQDTSRTTVTVSLQVANYKRLKAVCLENGWGISRAIDSVVQALLEEIDRERRE